MSITCTNVESSPLLKKLVRRDTIKFIRATIDRKTCDYLPFPSDYEFAPCFLPRKFSKIADRIHNFTVRPDDIWIITFPKSGTTWMQNIVQYLTNGLDFSVPILTPLSIFLEVAMLIDLEQEPCDEKFIACCKVIDAALDTIEGQPSPRIIKSHLPLQFLPKQIWKVQPKLIYMARNPKDVTVSLFHHFKTAATPYFNADKMEEFSELILRDCIEYAPLDRHISDFWMVRNLNFILFLTYEELSAHRLEYVKRISDFLGHSYDGDQLEKLADFVSFGKMKEKVVLPNNTMGKLVDSDFCVCRRGKVSGYRDEMSVELIKKFDDWIADRLHQYKDDSTTSLL